jgi:signal transduction histidine kinase/CheY-like chemotaxis protein
MQYMDYFCFSLLVVASLYTGRRLLRKHRGAELLGTRCKVCFVGLTLYLVAGFFLVQFLGQQASRRVQKTIEGMAPTYAAEMEQHGHAKIHVDTPTNDPVYLNLIETQKRWLLLNPCVADIYTIRKLPNGTNVFIVDSETDYNHDGRIEGEREQRTAIGEPFPQADPGLEQAFAGQANFNAEPITDRWGTWVSAMVPIRSSDGKIDAVLGVDFDASHFLHAIRISRLGGIALLSALWVIVFASGCIIALLQAELQERRRVELELRQAKEEAEAASRAKGAFLATISHEIRTPMNGVIGMTSLLLETPLQQEQREFAEVIRTSGETLLGIINDILDFSKAEQGRLPFEIRDFDLREVVEDVLVLLGGRGRQKGIELMAEFQANMPNYLQGDAGRMRQVLMNLVGNAVKFTERGEVVVKVSCLTETETKATLQVEITDTGIGIPQEAQARLFRPFTQVDSSTTRKYGGTGLGLAIVKQLVEQMGGQVSLRSTAGQGSVFSFSAVLGKAVAPAKQEITLRTSLMAGVPVLVVDDNETNRKLLEQLMEAWHLRGRCASSSEEALHLLQQAAAENAPFRVAILDMQMPGMDGVTLARTIKADPKISPTRLLILSSSDDRPDEAELKALGIASWMTKPFRQADLFSRLRELALWVNPAPLLSPVSKVSTPPKASGQPRLLVAEDNPVNQFLIVKQLEKLGYIADVVGSGTEVLAALAKHPYPLVFMDCQMPEMDGYEATRHIRALEKARLNQPGTATRLTIIAFTAGILPEEQQECKAAGMDDLLAKPVRTEELQAVLVKYLTANDANKRE